MARAPTLNTTTRSGDLMSTSTPARDVERTLPIPALRRAPGGGHGLALDEDGWEICSCCGQDWPCPADLLARPTEPVRRPRG